MDSHPAHPLVSYIVITMNRADELAGCLESIGAQAYPSKEIVVIDNGSTDNTAELIAKKFSNANLVRLETNQGVAGGRNRGAEAAHGEICIFIDDDARFADPSATQRTIDLFDADPGLACIAFPIRNAFTGEKDRKSIPRADKKRIAVDYPCAYFTGAGFSLRREPFLRAGKFWERLHYSGEELDLSYRLLDAGWRIVCAGGIEIRHREAPQSRPHGQWIYYNARNRPWVAARSLPWPCVISATISWWAVAFWISLRRFHLGALGRGIRDSLLGLPSVMRERRPLKKQTIRELRRLSGRLWR
jgi:GT2 family glycosyltransferase